MRNFLLLVFCMFLFTSCIKEHEHDDTINFQPPSIPNEDKRKIPDTVKTRTNEYLKIDTTIKSIKFQFHGSDKTDTLYCAIYEMNAYRMQPTSNNESNEYKAKVLDSIHHKVRNYIFLGKDPKIYNCDCEVIDVHFTNAYYWTFVM